MTNRTAELIATIREPQTAEEEALWLAGILADMGQSLSLENAGQILAKGIKNAPGVWLLTLEELPAIWTLALVTIQKAETQKQNC